MCFTKPAKRDVLNLKTAVGEEYYDVLIDHAVGVGANLFAPTTPPTAVSRLNYPGNPLDGVPPKSLQNLAVWLE